MNTRRSADSLPWPKPRPLSGSLPVVPRFDPGLLPEALRPWVVDLAERLQVPADYPAAALIVMLAGAVGRRASIRPYQNDDWTVFPNLWGAIIGRSGVMKSPVLNAILRPLRQRQSLAIAVYESERDAYQHQLRVERALRRNGRATMTADEPDGETTFDVDPPVLPVCRRFLINEATIEKVHVILKENPHGVVYVRDELSGWLAQLTDRDRAFFLEAWDGNGDFTFDRVGRGMVHAQALCLSVLGGIQPTRLQQYLVDAVSGGVGDDGFIQRFQVMVWPDCDRPWEQVDRAPEGRAERKTEQVIDQLLALSPEDPLRTHFHRSAYEVFVLWRKSLEERIRSGRLERGLESHLAKMRSLMPKLSLLFHLAEGDGGSEIPPAAAECAVNYCDYLESHAQRVYGSVTSPPLRLAARLGQKLRAGIFRSQFGPADVYLRGWAGLDTRESARAAISVLVDAGWIRPSSKSQSSTSAEYFVNPMIYSDIVLDAHLEINAERVRKA